MPFVRNPRRIRFRRYWIDDKLATIIAVFSGCLGVTLLTISLIIAALVLIALVDGILAWIIAWGVNAFTPWHPTFGFVFIVLFIGSTVFGGILGGRRS